MDRAWLREALLGHAESVRLSVPGARDGDADAVHDLRVGLRRSRSLLASYAPLLDCRGLPAEHGELRTWMQTVGADLGTARDRDVVHALLLDLLGAGTPLPDGPQVVAVAVLLDTPALARVLTALPAVAAGVPDIAPEDGWPCARAAWRGLRRRSRGTGSDAGPDALHRVRKAAKRARYAADALAPATTGKAAARLGRAADLARGVQGALGEHRDTVLLRAWLAAPGGDLDALASERGTLALAEYERLRGEVAPLRLRSRPPG